ncbi:helix-loop-helix protein delilah-like [Scylla paramamosain]|uniref:helix-loop-helix protein delilah-like n=1 Tax=Scylla paramamosain TaxID=85552 RepID=UPI0030827567
MESRKMDQADEVSSCTDNNNNDNTRGEQRRPTRVAEKYGLRPRTIIRRLQLERTRDDTPQRQFKTSKNRPPPLSKYRRKTANARERHRMKEINDAFETLRRVLPDFCSRRAAAAMTKITTLKLAVSYIRALSHILEDGHPGDITFFNGLNLADISMSRPLSQPPPHAHSVHYCHGSLRAPGVTEFPSPEISTAASHTLPRTSLGSSSSSDLSELLSDDSCVFEDNLDAFDDIPALPEVDPFALLLTPDTEPLALTS